MEIDNFLPGSASLIDMVDKMLLISTRDGKHFVGYLRSYDQFANLVIQDTIEISNNNEQKGIYLIRGENVVLLGEVEDENVLEDFEFTGTTKKSVDKRKAEILHGLGFCVDVVEGDSY